MTRRELFLLPFVTLVAVGGIAVGVLALTKAPPSTGTLSDQILSDQSALQADTTLLRHDRAAIARLTRQVAGLRNASTQAASVENLSALQGAVTNIDNTLNRYAVCVPQMMRYVNGIRPTGSWVQGTNGNRLLTYPISVISRVPISSACSWVLYGPPRS